MNISDIMTTGVVTAKPEETMKEVLLRLRKYNISGLPVVDNESKVVGIFSESGLMKMMPDILHEAEQIPLLDIKELTDNPISEVMYTPPLVISPDADIKEAAQIFLEKYVHRLAVVDDDGKLVGVVSLGDVLKSFVNA